MADLDRFIPELAAAVAFGLIGGFVWSRLVRIRAALGIGTATSLGVILAATFTPTGPFPEVGFAPGVCDLRHLGPGSLDELLALGEASLNVALFIPLGICVALHPAGPLRRLAIAGGIALPFLIEFAQLELPDLGRYCDSMDIADNVLGLLLGLAIGALLLGIRRLVRPRQPLDAAARPGIPHDPA